MTLPGNLMTTAMAVMPHTDIDEALKLALAKGDGAHGEIHKVGEFKVAVKLVRGVGGGQLRQLADELLSQIKVGAVLLGSDLGEKAQIVVKVSAKLHDLDAGELVSLMAPIVGGRGGGRKEMACVDGFTLGNLAFFA